jgi:hypothetical protein
MEVRERQYNSRMLKVDEQEFERQRELKLLRSTVTGDNGFTIETKQNCNDKSSQLWPKETMKSTIFWKTNKMCSIE